jgi:phosphatidylserine/phosphatidylglycerophosphate/cardiolipin synthase-like enzyme
MAHLRRRPGVAGSRWPDRLERIAGRATGTRPDYPRTVSTAFEDFASTRLGQFFGPAADEHPGLSGFSLLSHGREAFIVRLALADLAERSLDMQYYVWDGDTTGRIVVDHVMKAADRGVRVRLLVDDPYYKASDFVKASLELTPMWRSVCSTRWRTGAGQFSTSFSTSAGSIVACTTS